MTIVIKDDPILQKAHSEYKRFTADEKMQMAYLDREKAEHDRVSLLEQAVTRAEKKFKQERLKSAREMLADGMDARMISKYTGLSKEEIEKLM